MVFTVADDEPRIDPKDARQASEERRLNSAAARRRPDLPIIGVTPVGANSSVEQRRRAHLAMRSSGTSQGLSAIPLSPVLVGALAADVPPTGTADALGRIFAPASVRRHGLRPPSPLREDLGSVMLRLRSEASERARALPASDRHPHSEE